ncbi:hypothetical protein EKA14_24380 [Bacillus mycoides]|nr:hypothetical protein EKA14_24380 [Bacillus mycoides]
MSNSDNLLSRKYRVPKLLFKAIGTYNTNSSYGRVFKAQKDGNISVQFQAGANSSYMKKMNFTAKLAVSKLN